MYNFFKNGNNQMNATISPRCSTVLIFLENEQNTSHSRTAQRGQINIV